MAKVCVIGAGSSGITACKALADRGVEYDCFEFGSYVGGNWRFDNDNDMSAAYRTLHINTSREQMQYEDFPMPGDYPDYPGHELMAEYFDAYVDRFGIRDRIRFRTEVVSIEPHDRDGNRWLVRYRNWSGSHENRKYGPVETSTYSDVIVANGHHWDASWPSPPFPGAEDFEGEQIHSHDYKEPEVLRGKRVLVVGIGNSACDIAVDSSRTAEATAMSIRTGAHVVPKYLRGRPTDELSNPLTGRLPIWLQRIYLAVELRLAIGKVTDYGMPEPPHKLLSQHPTISSDLLPRLGHGDIEVRPNIAGFDGREVLFEDGRREEYDLVIYATGYKMTFPFLDTELFSAPGNELPIYRLVVPPEIKGLYFLGFVQPLGAIMPLAEYQARWVAALITGNARLPSKMRMKLSIALRRWRMKRRYARSDRHTVQVDFYPYLYELKRELRAGRRRVGDLPRP